ncbi:MAG: cell division protein SepF [Synechococcaceae cyanobacterium]|nr:cell division protein SepF [Synechococcaceae cyanobacterium]
MASLRPDGRQPTAGAANRTVIPLPLAQGRQLEVVAPERFEQAAAVIASVRAGRSVVLQADHLDPETGQRLIDFVCGGMAALDGQSQRLEDRVFLFAPAAVLISAL